MTKMTSACANKLLRRLNEEKEFHLARERDGHVYVAALDEEPVIPTYNYVETTNVINEIDKKMVVIKHAINLVNVNSEILVGDKSLSIDAILVRMAQLNKRKSVLDKMRKIEPKTRINSAVYSAKQLKPEYQYANYDVEFIKREYEMIDLEIATMQMALDKFNQTFEFEVDI